MRALITFVALTLIITFPHTSDAQRKYTVYKADDFGHRSALSEPEAIIEQDELTGDLKVYEPTLFGSPDKLKGPTYIIENDSLFAPRPLSSALGEPPCEQHQWHRHRHNHEDYDHGDSHDHGDHSEDAW